MKRHSEALEEDDDRWREMSDDERLEVVRDILARRYLYIPRERIKVVIKRLGDFVTLGVLIDGEPPGDEHWKAIQRYAADYGGRSMPSA